MNINFYNLEFYSAQFWGNSLFTKICSVYKKKKSIYSENLDKIKI